MLTNDQQVLRVASWVTMQPLETRWKNAIIYKIGDGDKSSLVVV